MPLSFPISPNINDTYTSGGVTWVWNGYAWDVDPQEDISFDDVFATTFHGVLDGNATTANSLFTSRQINGVSFNGTQNISINTLVNSTNTVTLDNSGNLVLTNSTQLKNVSAGGVRLESSANNGYVETMLTNNSVLNFVSVNQTNVQIAAQNAVSPGVYQGTGIILNATTGTSVVGPASFTGNITANSNINVATPPTQTQHATNKDYVDKRAVAFSIGLS